MHKLKKREYCYKPYTRNSIRKQTTQAREAYLNEMNTNSLFNRLDISSTSGGRLTKSEILCISDYNARAGTVHINMHVNMHIGPIESSIKNQNIVPITALHDSGCSKTIMSYDLYKNPWTSKLLFWDNIR